MANNACRQLSCVSRRARPYEKRKTFIEWLACLACLCVRVFNHRPDVRFFVSLATPFVVVACRVLFMLTRCNSLCIALHHAE